MFRLMTLNINYRASKHGAWDGRRAAIAATIRSADPDAVALQAVEQSPDGTNQAQELAELLPDYGSVLFQAAMEDDEGRARGSGFLVRVPVLEVSHRPLSLRTGLEDGDSRIVLRARVVGAQGPLTLFNAHFSWVEAQALDNLTETLVFLQESSGPALLAGDFNATPDSAIVQGLLRAGWVDGWTALRPNEEGFTFEADRPQLRIDYVFAEPLAHSRLQGIERLSVAGFPRLSDHLGLLATLS